METRQHRAASPSGVSGSENIPPAQQTNFAEPAPIIEQESFIQPIQQALNTENIDSTDGVIQLIEKLAQLHGAGALTDDEFNSKKSELLARI